MNTTDAMFHLDAAAHSVPEPVLPPDTLNSQISGILRAVRPFLDTDRDWILQNIELFQQQISVYDTLLYRIDEIKSEMQHHRDVVHKSLVAYSSTLAPIRRLPLKFSVLCFATYILRCGTRSPQAGRRQRRWDFSQGPWKLSHVCGAWRDIALSYPQLWSHILLRFGQVHRIGRCVIQYLRSKQ